MGVARAREVLGILEGLLKAPWMPKVERLLGGSLGRLSNAKKQLEGPL